MLTQRAATLWYSPAADPSMWGTKPDKASSSEDASEDWLEEPALSEALSEVAGLRKLGTFVEGSSRGLLPAVPGGRGVHRARPPSSLGRAALLGRHGVRRARPPSGGAPRQLGRSDLALVRGILSLRPFRPSPCPPGSPHQVWPPSARSPDRALALPPTRPSDRASPRTRALPVQPWPGTMPFRPLVPPTVPPPGHGPFQPSPGRGPCPSANSPLRPCLPLGTGPSSPALAGGLGPRTTRPPDHASPRARVRPAQPWPGALPLRPLIPPTVPPPGHGPFQSSPGRGPCPSAHSSP